MAIKYTNEEIILRGALEALTHHYRHIIRHFNEVYRGDKDRSGGNLDVVDHAIEQQLATLQLMIGTHTKR